MKYPHVNQSVCVAKEELAAAIASTASACHAVYGARMFLVSIGEGESMRACLLRRNNERLLKIRQELEEVKRFLRADDYYALREREATPTEEPDHEWRKT